MEWPKIKSILIIALLFTNLLLIGLICFLNLDSDYKNDSDLISDTVQLLKENNVVISTTINETDVDLPVLFLDYDKIKGRFLYSADNQNNKSSITQKEAESEVELFLADLNISNTHGKDSVRLESAIPLENSKDTLVLTYGNYYKDYKIDGIYNRVYIEPNGITKMERNWAYIDSAGKVSREIIPVTTALLKYMTQDNNEISNNNPIEITDIELVYRVESSYSEQVTSDTAFPTWKITDSNKNVSYISAYK